MVLRILALFAFVLVSGCKPKCILGNSNCSSDWQKTTVRTCKATLKLSNIDFPVVMSLRVVASEEMFTTPPSQWDPSTVQTLDRDGYPEIACRSNLFADLKIQKSKIAELSDQVCSITVPDDQQTRYDLSWHTDETVGKALKEGVGLATVSSKSLPATKITLNSVGLDPDYFKAGTGKLFQSVASTLHFTEIPIAVEYVQTLKDGQDSNNTSEDGKRYRIYCHATNLTSSYSASQSTSERDPGAFQETCRFSVISSNTVAVTPTTDGIKAQLLSDQGAVLQEVSSHDCQ